MGPLVAMKTLVFLGILISSASCHLNRVDREALVAKVDTHIRPSEKTVVEMNFVLTALNKLDSVKQELGTTFLLYMTWTDTRLTWAPDNTKPDSIVFSDDEIWTPPLVVNNAIKDSTFLLHKDTFPLRVNYNGTVTWIPRLSPTTTCEVDIAAFPVDKQVCYINITSWVHSTDELILVRGNTSHYPEDVNLDFYTENKAWDLTDKSLEFLSLTGGYGIEYYQISYKFDFRRQETFYWFLLVYPGICLAFLQTFVFLIPLNAQGTRLSYATTMLLSFIFYTSILTRILPPIFSRDKVSVIGESFRKVMISGTVITVLVIFEMFATSIINMTHPENEKGIGIVCKDCCCKCIILQVFNFLIFIAFLIVYSIGIHTVHCLIY